MTEITSSVWETFLPDGGEIVVATEMPTGASLTGVVSIGGEWNGLVSLTCSSVAANRAAALMFGSDEEEVSRSDALDAVGELVNIVGGNLKGTVSGSTGLSVPSVTDGTLHVDSRAGADLIVDIHLSWGDEPVHVAIWSKDEPFPA